MGNRRATRGTGFTTVQMALVDTTRPRRRRVRRAIRRRALIGRVRGKLARCHERCGWTALEMIGVLILVVLLTSLASYSYMSYQRFAHVRLCQDQQRTLQNALDAAGLGGLDMDIDTLFKRLIAEKMIAREVNDPGFAKGSSRHYVLMMGSHKIGCRIHGSPFLP